jgi:drug/metabolite transporter (DMT)-like permease
VTIIMSIEMVFSVLAGWIVLHEQLTLWNLIGCALMFAEMLVTQLFPSIPEQIAHFDC